MIICHLNSYSGICQVLLISTPLVLHTLSSGQLIVDHLSPSWTWHIYTIYRKNLSGIPCEIKIMKTLSITIKKSVKHRTLRYNANLFYINIVTWTSNDITIGMGIWKPWYGPFSIFLPIKLKFQWTIFSKFNINFSYQWAIFVLHGSMAHGPHHPNH